MNWKKAAVMALIVAALVGYFAAGGDNLFDPRKFETQFRTSPAMTAAVFFLVFVVGTALSLPVTGVLSVIAGMTFGHAWGVPLTLLACTLGGTLAFLMSRYVLRNLVQRRFASQLQQINAGVQKDGTFYLFGLRMIPVIPFWLLNLLAGLSPIDVRRFCLATITGMLPLVAVLVHFGTQLQSLDHFSLRALLSPGLLASLALLGVMPFVARGVLKLVQYRLRGL